MARRITVADSARAAARGGRGGSSADRDDAPARDRASMLERPLVVVGALRSGTTMLRLMLDAHPGLHVFGEFEEAVSQAGDTGWPDPDRFRAWLRTDRAWLAKSLDAPEGLEHPELVRRWVAQLDERAPSRTIGFCVHSRFDRCPDLWPAARYVHILRDPRDVARSCIGMGWAGTAWHGAATWIDAERRWDRLRERIEPEAFVEVRYEELVSDPERALAPVLALVGERWDPSMLAYDEHSTYERPDAAYAEQWRRKMTDDEIADVEARCGALLESRGYARHVVPPRAPDARRRRRLARRDRIGRMRFEIARVGFLRYAGRVLDARGLLPAPLAVPLRHQLNRIEERHLR